MSSMGKRIKRRRQELGFSVTQVAEKIGKTTATIYRYESEEIENMPFTVLSPLAKALHTSEAYLLCWVDDPEWKPSQKIEDNKKVPLLRHKIIGTDIFETENVDRLTSPPDGAIADFAIIARDNDLIGHSIKAGDMVYCKLTEDAANGDAVVVIVNETVCLKILQSTEPSNQKVLVSDNSKTAPVVLAENVRIIGKPIAVLKTL